MTDFPISPATPRPGRYLSWECLKDDETSLRLFIEYLVTDLRFTKETLFRVFRASDQDLTRVRFDAILAKLNLKELINE